ncbi:MAG: regulatory protein RecX [Prevotella sp.]
MKKISKKEALLRLSALCSQAEHCSSEMTEKMRKWELTDEEQADVMEYLTRERYIDDERFARAFAIDKIRYNKWGRRKVEQALWMKHIDDGIRQRVLDEIAPEEYDNVLRALLKSKMRSIKAADTYERNMKLMRFALGRGFNASEVRELLEGDWEK